MKLRLCVLPLITALSLSSCTLSASTWQPYTFDGTSFHPGEITGKPSLWLRDGFIPRTETPPAGGASDLGSLPPKSGAVAGICYLQTSGGKLADQSGVTPYPDEQIIIRTARDGIFVTRTDSNGLFAELLYPGEYEFSCRGAGIPAVVKEGKTTLIHIRGGKRMAD